MTEHTPIDRAHLAAEADETLRPRFYDRLLESELFVVLEEEPATDTIRPVIVDTSDGQIALAFDREDRMASFMEGITPYAALTGRRLIAMLKGQDIGLALNLGGAPSETILPAQAVDWAAQLTEQPTEIRESAVREIRRPGNLPEVLITALGEKLPTLEGLASEAWLAGVLYRDGSNGHILAVTDALPPAQNAIAEAIAEALRLSGLEAGTLDVAFFASQAPVMTHMRKMGLGFELPKPTPVEVQEITAPGSDPTKPPRLL